MSALGAYSREIALARPDGRTREGRLLRQVREELTRHLGGKLSPTQTVLVERAAYLQLRVTKLDERILAGSFTQFDGKEYLAWINTLRRVMVALGLDGRDDRPPSLTEIMRNIHGRTGAAP